MRQKDTFSVRKSLRPSVLSFSRGCGEKLWKRHSQALEKAASDYIRSIFSIWFNFQCDTIWMGKDGLIVFLDILHPFMKHYKSFQLVLDKREPEN